MINVRRAAIHDGADMAHLLNRIISEGGTTALTRAVTGDDLISWMNEFPDSSAWHVAVDDASGVTGFQWITPSEKLPPEAAEIATFVQTGRTGLGIGSALFRQTEQAARLLGYRWINANIRADNEGGLIYYQSRGFEDYGTIKDYQMSDGRVVDKRLKRYDL